MALSSANPFKQAGRPERILVVDDDLTIRKAVQYRLEAVGYQVWTAADGEEALKLVAERGLPHLAIVDVMMPGMTGFELCEELQTYSDLPVIMLTAVSDEKTIVRGIRFFAEDYVTKPFRAAELVARVERVLRRIGSFAYTDGPGVEVDNALSVDFAHQRVVLHGESVELTPTETKILYILMRSAGRPVTTDFLRQRLWPHEERYEDALRVHIYRLRQKVEPDPRKPRYVLTERDVGYRFAPRS